MNQINKSSFFPIYINLPFPSSNHCMKGRCK